MAWSGIDIPVGGDVGIVALGADGRLAQDSSYVDGLLAGPTQAVWDAARPGLERRLRSELGRGDLVAPGFTLYDLDVRLGVPVALTTRRTMSGDIKVTVVTGAHTVIATSTTPTIFGSWTDPRFSVDFGLVFEYVLALPPVTGPVSATGLRLVRLTGIHPDSQNAIADIAAFVVDVVEFFAGGPLLQRALRWLEEMDWSASLRDAFGPGLTAFNATLERLAASGHHLLEAMVGDAGELARQLGDDADAARAVLDALPAGSQQLLLVCRAPDTSGVLEGEVSWPASRGAPMSAAELAVFRALTATYMEPTLQARALRRMVGGPVPPEPASPATTHHLDVLLGKADVAPDELAGHVAAPSAARIATEVLASRPGFNLLAGGPPGAPTVDLEPVAPTVAIHPVDDFRARLGGTAAYELVTERFRRGPLQFDVTCTATVEGRRLTTGRMTVMWFDDDEHWCRRRFRLEGVWTDTPLEVSCALAEGWGWPLRAVEEVAARNWDGRVTVHRARPITEAVGDGVVQVTVSLADGQHRTLTTAALEAAGVLAPATGRRALLVRSGVLADEIALNPQPLPPEPPDGVARRPGNRAIVILGGRLGEEVEPDPRPLPPRELSRWARLFDDLATRSIIIVGGAPGQAISLNPQPLPPKEGPTAEVVGGGLFDDLATRSIIVVGGREPTGEHLDDGLRPVDLSPAVRRLVLKDRATSQQGDVVGIASGLRATLHRHDDVEVAGGRAVPDRDRAEPAGLDRASVVVAKADRFGDLELPELLDPDILIPDVHDPVGWGTVRGIDFRVVLA